METLIVFHEVEDGALWAKAWKKGSGSRHEMFREAGVTARVFRDPENPAMTGLILEVPDLARFQSFLASQECQQAMVEDRLKVETMRLLREFAP